MGLIEKMTKESVSHHLALFEAEIARCLGQKSHRSSGDQPKRREIPEESAGESSSTLGDDATNSCSSNGSCSTAEPQNTNEAPDVEEHARAGGGD